MSPCQVESPSHCFLPDVPMTCPVLKYKCSFVAVFVSFFFLVALVLSPDRLSDMRASVDLSLYAKTLLTVTIIYGTVVPLIYARGLAGQTQVGERQGFAGVT